MGAVVIRRTSPRVVEAVWRALRDGVEPGRAGAVSTFARRFGGADLVPQWAVLDLVDDLGLRDLAHADGLLAAFGVGSVTGYARPKARAKCASGGDHVATADVAALLIRLERHGLPIDPAPLVEAVRAGLVRKPVLTGGEVDVWWFAKERHRCRDVTLTSCERDFATIQKARTSSGYRAEAWITAGGVAAQIMVRPPVRRWRAAA